MSLWLVAGAFVLGLLLGAALVVLAAIVYALETPRG